MWFWVRDGICTDLFVCDGGWVPRCFHGLCPFIIITIAEPMPPFLCSPFPVPALQDRQEHHGSCALPTRGLSGKVL